MSCQYSSSDRSPGKARNHIRSRWIAERPNRDLPVTGVLGIAEQHFLGGYLGRGTLDLDFAKSNWLDSIPENAWGSIDEARPAR